jgi:hypothetical protein
MEKAVKALHQAFALGKQEKSDDARSTVQVTP